MDDVGERYRGRRVGIRPEHAVQRRIGIEQHAGLGNETHADRRVLERPPETRLDFRARADLL